MKLISLLILWIVVVISKPNLEKYVDDLPIPPVVTLKANNEITYTQFTQKLHRDLPPTTLWSFNNVFPGPTIEVQRGIKAKVDWKINLPDKHLIPTKEFEWNQNLPHVRVVPHIHGLNVASASDGFPTLYKIPNNTLNYEYENNQQATMLWYHDHAQGITRSNIYAGLFGAYIIRDSFEKSLNLPQDKYEIPILIVDRNISDNGSLYYPYEWEPEFYGDFILVNGKVWPFLNVEPRKYRLRILNAANGRFFNISLNNSQVFHQIGSDGGFLEMPLKLNSILIAPGERVDVILDFSNHTNETINVINSAPSPYPEGEAPDEDSSQVFQIRVVLPLSHPDNSTIPNKFIPIIRPDVKNTFTRYFTFVELKDENDKIVSTLINGTGFAPNNIKVTPTNGTSEIWEFINLTEDTHPMHVHLVQFLVLNRQPFDAEKYEKEGILNFTGPSTLPDANEMGFKDTVRANKDEVTRVLLNFHSYTGKYLMHCHIIEHEDNDMMLAFEVKPGNDTTFPLWAYFLIGGGILLVVIVGIIVVVCIINRSKGPYEKIKNGNKGIYM